MPVTAADALREAEGTISRRDAETLLIQVLGCERVWLLAHPEMELGADFRESFRNLVRRRAAQEPLQYLTGEQEFYGLRLRVTPDVLIPRPETEHLVEAVLLWATRFHDERMLRIADIGTGSGAIVIALATHLAGAEFFATDLSSRALAIAKENAATHGCEERIDFMESDLLAGLDEEMMFDAIVSNPPYVAAGDAATMQPEVVNHEPHMALFAGADGLDVYRRLIPAARERLREGGLLAMEIGYGQRELVAGLLAGWEDVRLVDDYQGIPRVVLATR